MSVRIVIRVVLALLLMPLPCRAADRDALMRAHRGGELHLAAYQSQGTIDPQVNYQVEAWQLEYGMQDQLLTFRKAEGPPGMELVPDLADAMPQMRDGGRTYVFHLRPGIKFSTGQEVTVADVAASYRRMFKVLGPNIKSWYGIIVGADACLKTPATCTLAGGVETEPATNTITLHLTQPDSEFLDKIALPFACILPANTPPHDLGTTPPATTGPYMVQSYNPVRSLIAVRNPYFHQWSAEAQPDGFVDRIVYRFGLTDEAEVTEIENGAIDWKTENPPLDRLAEIGGEYPQLAHINKLSAYYYLELNTHLPPFDNEKARQAVAYAVNRKVVVNLVGGPALGSPICQLLPAGIPGHQAYCPYTRNPGATWSAPDLAKARALVRESGTAGMKVTLICSDIDIEHSMGIYLQSVLADIGYQASLHAVSYSIRDPYLENSNNHVQIGLTNWFQDYPSPADFLNVLLSCASFRPGSDASINMSGFCDPAIDARMHGAMTTALTDQDEAARQWTAIDHTLTDRAPLVTLFQINYLDLTSARVGHFTYSPLFHVMFSELWVQ